jgi:hypothetical protein
VPTNICNTACKPPWAIAASPKPLSASQAWISEVELLERYGLEDMVGLGVTAIEAESTAAYTQKTRIGGKVKHMQLIILHETKQPTL